MAKDMEEKEYILTDQCFFKEYENEIDQKGYNPYDSSRTPHTTVVCDPDNGTLVHIPCGSIIKIVKMRENHE